MLNNPVNKKTKMATQHLLVPKHEKLSDKDKAELLKSYSISVNELPRILLSDPAIADLSVKEGDVIKVTRKSATSGEAYYYRGVVNG